MILPCSAEPITTTEAVVADVWAQALGRKRIAIDQSFSALGGRVESALTVIASLRGRFGITLPLQTLVGGVTVRELASQIEHTLRQHDVPLPPLVRRPPDDPALLSFAQESLWQQHARDPESVLHVVVGVRLRGPLDRAALADSLADIVARHRVLRTSIIDDDGLPAPIVAAETTVAIEDVVRCHADDALMPSAAEAQLIDDARHERFDPADSPLLRARLVQVGATEHLLLLVLHALAADQRSGGIVARELVSGYCARSAGRPAPTVDVALQYADFAAWERSWLQAERWELRLAYWRSRLAGVPPLMLPTDLTRTARARPQTRHVTFGLDVERSRAIEACVRREGVTLQAMLLAAYQLLLWRYTGQVDVTVGVATDRRPDHEAGLLVGPFANMVAIRADLGGDPTVAAITKHAHEALLEALHHELPFDRVVQAVDPARTGERPALASVAVVFDDPIPDWPPTDVDIALVIAPSRAAHHELVLRVTGGNVIHGSFVYDAELLAPSLIARLAASWTSLLAAIAVHPESTIQDISWSDGLEGTRRESPFTGAFDEDIVVVDRGPDLTAAVRGGR